MAASTLVLAGCSTAPAPDAGRARARLEAQRQLASEPAPLPGPGAASSEEEYVRFALARHPAVHAAFSEWHAVVAAIAPAQALPDPRLTLEADIAGTIMSLMPGVMFDLMAPGQRAAMGREATAAGEVARRGYVATLVQVAAEVRRALVDLAYLDEALRLQERAVVAVEQSGRFAAAGYASGRGMGTSLESQIRAASEADRLRNTVAALADRRATARVRLKSALGLGESDPDPAWPQLALAPTALPSPDELWQRVAAENADLARMRAMVDMAVAQEEVAARNRTPGFAAGLMADVRASPVMWRPTASLTLPIWREKIAGLVEAAGARREAAMARVEAETIAMAARFSSMLYLVREADRAIALIDSSGLPNLERTRLGAGSAYRTGAGSVSMLADLEAMDALMRVERAVALRDRELAVIDLLAMTTGVAAGGFPPTEAFR